MRNRLRFLFHVYKYRVKVEECADYERGDYKCVSTCSKIGRIA